jgi:hypothetical protein
MTIKRDLLHYWNFLIRICTRILSVEMRHPTPVLSSFLNESGPTFVLRPRRSRLMAIWWSNIHIGACIATISLPLPWGPKLLLLVSLACHSWFLVPASPPRLIRSSGGKLFIPSLATRPLGLDPQTRFADWWVRLRLIDCPGRAEIVLLRDQLSGVEWRALQAALRRPPRTLPAP